MRPAEKVNKEPSDPWRRNFENDKKQNVDLITMLIIPENMNPQSPYLETQWSFVKYSKIGSFGVFLLQFWHKIFAFLEFKGDLKNFGHFL